MTGGGAAGPRLRATVAMKMKFIIVSVFGNGITGLWVPINGGHKKRNVIRAADARRADYVPGGITTVVLVPAFLRSPLKNAACRPREEGDGLRIQGDQWFSARK